MARAEKLGSLENPFLAPTTACRSRYVGAARLPLVFSIYHCVSKPEDSKARKLLTGVCGPAFLEGPVCCTTEQVETLRDNFNQVEGLVSSCPACRNNFRAFFCTFTCSPQQRSFVNVTSTQEMQNGRIAVKSVDFYVAREYGEGFFNSCKSVQVGATNGYAMDLIGGGAKDYHKFLSYMGEEKPIGSPFQIDFPLTAPPPFNSLNATTRNCADADLASRCTCIGVWTRHLSPVGRILDSEIFAATKRQGI